jgi:UDP-3-O-[3-hydroxymyristoyl] glucosamine N-acyltransferase
MSTTQAPSTQFTVQELAALVGGTVHGAADTVITSLNRIEYAQQGELTFLSNEKYVKFLELTKASCVLISASFNEVPTDGRTYIVTDDAYRSFVLIMQRFFPPVSMERSSRHASAIIHPTATIAPTAAIGPGCVIGENCTIGDDVQLYANVVLYANVSVGNGTVMHANVVCCNGVRIGQRNLIHAGAVIGSDGFGFLENPDGSYEKVPQVGIVITGDDVEIGANTTIDRAAVGATRIGNGVKLDNLVQIGHNVEIGENTAIASQAGIAGSAKLGKRMRVAGQVGIIGHINIGDDVVIFPQSGVSKALAGPGHYFGSPAKEHATALRMEAALRQLPTLLQEFRELQRQLEELKRA